MKLNLCSILLDYYYSWLPDFMRCELESYYYVSSLMVQGFDTKCTWSDPNCLRIWIWAHTLEFLTLPNTVVTFESKEVMMMMMIRGSEYIRSSINPWSNHLPVVCYLKDNYQNLLFSFPALTNWSLVSGYHHL